MAPVGCTYYVMIPFPTQLLARPLPVEDGGNIQVKIATYSKQLIHKRFLFPGVLIKSSYSR